MHSARVTKAAVLKLAKQRYGANSVLREDKAAPVGERRDAMRQRLHEIRDRLTVIIAEREKYASHWQALLQAAEFVCDVDGDAPSIPKLRDAVALSRSQQDLSEEKKSLEQERDRIRYELLRSRYYVEDRNGFATGLRDGSDTLEELAAKLAPPKRTETAGWFDAIRGREE